MSAVTHRWVASLPETWSATSSSTGTSTLGSAGSLMVIATFLYVLAWNVRDFPNSRFDFPTRWNWPAHILRVDQWWGMFAPYPMQDDGWYVIPAKLFDGRKVDLFRHGSPVSFEKPALVSSTYPNQRWRKYMMNIWTESKEGYRLYYGQYRCREWNDRHMGNERVNTFKIFYMRENTLASHRTAEPEKVMIWQHYCYTEPESWDD